MKAPQGSEFVDTYGKLPDPDNYDSNDGPKFRSGTKLTADENSLSDSKDDNDVNTEYLWTGENMELWQ